VNWKEPEVWVPIAAVTAFVGLFGYAMYSAEEKPEPVRVLSTQSAPAPAPVGAVPVAATPGVQQAPTVVVQQPHHEENSFLENMMIWRGVSSMFDSSPSTVHTREVHHVVHQPAPVAPVKPAPVNNHFYGTPAPQHHGFVSTPASSPAKAPSPTYKPVSRPVSAIRTSSPSRSSSSSRPSGGRR